MCGASAYDKKYYFNNRFEKLPENVKEELHIICVLFTEEVGGIFTIGYTPMGEVVMDTRADEEDLLYDDIGSGLLIKKIRSTKQELFRALSIYYKVTFLHMDPATLLEEDEEDPETDMAEDTFTRGTHLQEGGLAGLGDDDTVTQSVFSEEGIPGEGV